MSFEMSDYAIYMHMAVRITKATLYGRLLLGADIRNIKPV